MSASSCDVTLQIERTVAYDATTTEVSKWDPVVRENRKVSVRGRLLSSPRNSCECVFLAGPFSVQCCKMSRGLSQSQEQNLDLNTTRSPCCRQNS